MSKKDLEAVVLEIKNSSLKLLRRWLHLKRLRVRWIRLPKAERKSVNSWRMPKRVNQRAKVEIETEESLGADFLFKGLTDATPRM